MIRAYIAGGVVLALIGSAVWIDQRARQAERDRIEAQEARDNEATRDRVRDADRSSGDADEDLDWLCRRFGVACVQLVPTPGD